MSAWLRSTFKAVGNRVLEYISEPKDDVRQLEDHWRGLLEEHERLVSTDATDIDDINLLMKTEISVHIEEIIRLILEETEDVSIDAPAGPCIEFLLERDVIKHLCAMGTADRPRGMLALCLYAVNKILVPNVHTLLPNMGIHDAIHHLIAVCIQLHEKALSERAVAFREAAAASGSGTAAGAPATGRSASAAARARQRTQGMVVQLVRTVWWAIRDNPSLITCFFETGSTPRLEPPAAPSQRRSRNRELLLLRAVLPHMKDPRLTGDRARDALVCAVALRNPAVTGYIMRYTNLCAELAAGVADKFNCLNMDSNASSTELLASRAMNDFLVMLRFANAVAVTGSGSFPRLPSGASPSPAAVATPGGAGDGTTAQQSLGHHLLSCLLTRLLEDTLRPCLLHTSEVRARSATVYVHGMVAELDCGSVTSPILTLLLRFLVGDADAAATQQPSPKSPPSSPAPGPGPGPGPAPAGDGAPALRPPSIRTAPLASDAALGAALGSFDGSVRAVLTQRLDALNHDLALATAELFGELVALNHPLVLQRLVLDELVPAAGTLLDEAGPLSAMPVTATPVPPATPAAPASPADAALDDGGGDDGDTGAGAGAGAGEAAEGLVPPPQPSRLVSVACRGVEAELLALLSGAAAVAADPTFASYVMDAQHQVVSTAVAYETWGDAWWDAHVEGADADGAPRTLPSCTFLDALLRKLQSTLSQPPPLNLAVTGMLSRLSQHGNPLVHAYLFPRSAMQHTPPPHGHAWTSLASVLVELWASAQRRAERVPEFATAVAMTRSRILADLEPAEGGAAAGTSSGNALSPRAQDRMMYTFSKERRTFIEAYVLLEEFVKELAAVLSAKEYVLVRLAEASQEHSTLVREPEPEDALDKAPSPVGGAGAMPDDDAVHFMRMGGDPDANGDGVLAMVDSDVAVLAPVCDDDGSDGDGGDAHDAAVGADTDTDGSGRGAASGDDVSET